mgnify:CR=1 FL=1
MKAIVFDVDDTLYDLSTPFKETCREVFPEDKDLDLEGAFLASRRYSDSVYARCLSGEMSMEEMYIYRFKMHFLIMGRRSMHSRHWNSKQFMKKNSMKSR